MLLYVYNPETGSKSEENGFWVSAFSPKNLRAPPIGQKIKIIKHRLYCIQNDRLCNTITTKQSVK